MKTPTQTQSNLMRRQKVMKLSLLGLLCVQMTFSNHEILGYLTGPSKSKGQGHAHLSLLDDGGGGSTSQIPRGSNNLTDVVGISDNATNAISSLTANSRENSRDRVSTSSTTSSDVAAISDDVAKVLANLLAGSRGETANTNNNVTGPELAASNSEITTEQLVLLCDRNFSVKKDGDNYTFTEVMEANCTDNCSATEINVTGVEAATSIRDIVNQHLVEVVCSEVAQENSNEGNEEEEQISQWEQCESIDETTAQLDCYVDALSNRRTFLKELKEEHGDFRDRSHILRAIQAKLRPVNELLESLIESDDSLEVAEAKGLSQSLAKALSDIFKDRYVRKLTANPTSEQAQQRMILTFESFARRSDFRVQELDAREQSLALKGDVENIRRQMVGLHPDSLQLMQGFISGYMNHTNNPQYYTNPFFRMQVDSTYQHQIQLMSHHDTIAATLAAEWFSLAQQGAQLRGEQIHPLQQLVASERDPRARSIMAQSYSSLIQETTTSLDLTKNQLYDPYFMPLSLLNDRTSSVPRQDAQVPTQFYTAPTTSGAPTVSSLPGNSRDQGRTVSPTMLNERTSNRGQERSEGSGATASTRGRVSH